ncbi:PF06013 domain protein [Actinomadura rubteroloni]|uniref:ESAT-6-like protein n=1 Tax=Actinomadura rubteroloni TaxID=1926885 RepID=A0A2P4UP46_9ACTN|nr:WXG100 family type VII secretion target [Actinomadura rubteroloni]POM26825.1 PF06013 domain protein [Actinomadura rubteroloni]
MSQAFSTDYQAMQQAEQMFQAKHRQMVELLDALESDLQSGLARWEDDARDAYFEARAKWDKAARDQAKSIDEFAKSVGTARTNYQSAERSNVDQWS